jgi:hypothetical protein
MGDNFLNLKFDIFGGNQRSWIIVCCENLKLNDYFGDIFVDIFRIYIALLERCCEI